MAHKNATRHDAHAPDEIDLSVLSCGPLVQMVINLRWRLGEQRAKADRERELVVIHAIPQNPTDTSWRMVNHQLLM